MISIFDCKVESFYFLKRDEEGRNIFLPFGSFRLGHYIKDDQKKNFIRYYEFIFFAAFVLSVALIYPIEIFRFISTFGFFVIVLNLSLVVKFGFPYLYAISIGAPPAAVAYSASTKYSSLEKALFCNLSGQFICILLGLLLAPSNMFLWGAAAYVMIAYPILLLFFFYKGKSFSIG